MAVVTVALPHHQYDVTIEPGSLARVGEIVRGMADTTRCAVITDANVAKSHGAAVGMSLEAAGYAPLLAVLASGEAEKTLDTVRKLYQPLLEARLDRRAPLIAVGGGVTGDTAGFVAATYLRGIPFVQCPTTLLAMVDSSVGGKVGVNVPQGKNLVGAFYQPVAVIADPETLRTLPLRELRCGLAECIKHAVICDAGLFEFLERRADDLLALDAEALAELVRRNVEIKAAVVMEDEKESGVRAHLNLGHTFGHAIEATVGYGTILHGEAVALGLIAAATTAECEGTCEKGVAERVRTLVSRVGLADRADLPPDDSLAGAMKLDKKVQADRVRFVLPTRIGEVVIRDDVEPEAVVEGWAAIRE